MQKFLPYLLAILVIGCQTEIMPDNQTTDNQSTPGTPTTPGATPGETPGQAPQGDQEAMENLRDIIDQEMEYRVTYQVTAAGETSELTQYVMGEDRRTDIIDGIQLRTYTVDGVSTLCSMEETEWICSEAPNTITAEQRMIQDMRQNLESYQVESLPPRQIIGSETECYRVTMVENAAEYCFLENVPLYASFGEGQNAVQLMATSFSTTVAEEVFELPAEGNQTTDGMGIGNETNGQMNETTPGQPIAPVIPTTPEDTVVVPENTTIIPADGASDENMTSEDNQTEANDSDFDVGY